MTAWVILGIPAYLHNLQAYIKNLVICDCPNWWHCISIVGSDCGGFVLLAVRESSRKGVLEIRRWRTDWGTDQPVVPSMIFLWGEFLNVWHNFITKRCCHWLVICRYIGQRDGRGRQEVRDLFCPWWLLYRPLEKLGKRLTWKTELKVEWYTFRSYEYLDWLVGLMSTAELLSHSTINIHKLTGHCMHQISAVENIPRHQPRWVHCPLYSYATGWSNMI